MNFPISSPMPITNRMVGPNAILDMKCVKQRQLLIDPTTHRIPFEERTLNIALSQTGREGEFFNTLQKGVYSLNSVSTKRGEVHNVIAENRTFADLAQRYGVLPAATV